MGRLKRKEILSELTRYVNSCVSKGRYPTYKELKQKHTLSYWKITLGDIYGRVRVNISKLPFKKPRSLSSLRRKELIKYIKQEVKKNHYPTRREIERNFNLKLDTLFGNISDLYNTANLKYKQSVDQEIKSTKAKYLIKIVLSLLPELTLSLIRARNISARGVDIIAKDKEKKIIGLELKAYNKFEIVKKRNIAQLENFTKKEKLGKIILITTASQIEKGIKIPPNTQLILYPELKDLIKDRRLKKLLYFIRNASPNLVPIHKITKRHKIISYVKRRYKEGKNTTYKDILHDMNLDLYTYFDDIYEMYSVADIPVPIRRGIAVGRRAKSPNEEVQRTLREKIIKYIKSEAKKGHYPSGYDIGRKIGISHIWNFFRMTDICREAGIEPYLERESRTTSF